MTVKYQVEVFKANNSDLQPTDIVYDFKSSVDSANIVHTHFRTKEKYLDVLDVTDGGSLLEDGKCDQVIEVSPFILDDEHNDIGHYDIDEYFNHPNWFILLIRIKCSLFNERSFIPLVTPEKYEYHIAHIPIDRALGFDIPYDEHRLVV